MAPIVSLALLATACSESRVEGASAALCSLDSPCWPDTQDLALNIDPDRHFGRDAAFVEGAVPVDTEAFHCGFCEEVVTGEDSCAGATKGAVWYGLWEDAVAEVERTGKPLLIHFGSPRHIEVCGVW